MLGQIVKVTSFHLIGHIYYDTTQYFAHCCVALYSILMVQDDCYILNYARHIDHLAIESEMAIV